MTQRNKLFFCTNRFTGFTEVSEEDNDTGASLVLTRASTFASVKLKVSEVSHNARGKDFHFISQMIEHIKSVNSHILTLSYFLFSAFNLLLLFCSSVLKCIKLTLGLLWLTTED